VGLSPRAQWKKVTMFFGVAPLEHMALNSTSFFFSVFWSLSSLDPFHMTSIFFSFPSLELFPMYSIRFLFSLSRMYMLLGLLVAVTTNLLESYSLISHLWESNLRMYP
jgi:hypothetical protein